MDIIDALKRAEKLLLDRGADTPRLDAEVLLAHALGLKRVDLYMQAAAPDQNALELFHSFIERRAEGCPVAYITSTKEFWSIPIHVTPDVLIPRPETELVVETALACLSRACAPEHLRTGETKTRACAPGPLGPCVNTNPGAQALRRSGANSLQILDICTGSGCIAAALATEMPAAHFVVTDVSPAALEVARKNLAFAGNRIEYCVGDLFEVLKNSNICAWAPGPLGAREKNNSIPQALRRSGAQVQIFNIITANPPYIPAGDISALPREIKEHEPKSALLGGESGLDFATRIINDAHAFLKPGGSLVMEFGIGQAARLVAIANECGRYADIKISKDLAGIERVIYLSKHDA